MTGHITEKTDPPTYPVKEKPGGFYQQGGTFSLLVYYRKRQENKTVTSRLAASSPSCQWERLPKKLRSESAGVYKAWNLAVVESDLWEDGAMI